jgi:hypothetical protein
VSRKLCELFLKSGGLVERLKWLKFFPDVNTYLGTLNHWQTAPSLDEFKPALKQVQTVRSGGVLRDLSSYAEIIESPEHALQVINEAKEEVESMTVGHSLITNSQATEHLLESIELWEKGDLSKVLIPFGFKMLDAFTLGLRRGKLNILAAPSGNGKSQFARQVAFGAARRGYKVLYISLEMDTDEVIPREASAQTSIDSNAILLHKASPDEYATFKAKVIELGKLPIHWVTTGDTSLATIKGLVNQLGDVDLIVVDYVKLLADAGKNELERMEALARGLFLLASNHVNRNGTKPAILAIWDIAKTYMKDSLVLDMEAIAFGGHKDASLVITMTNKAYPAKHRNHPLHKELVRELETRYDLPLDYVGDILDVPMITPSTVLFNVAKARNMGSHRLIPHMYLDGRYNRFMEGDYQEWMPK